jgi:hypothetical protein
VYPKRHHGKPVRSFDLRYSRPTQELAINSKKNRESLKKARRLAKQAGNRAR